MKFQIVIVGDGGDLPYAVTVPALPGLIFAAYSVEEAKADAPNRIVEWFGLNSGAPVVAEVSGDRYSADALWSEVEVDDGQIQRNHP